MSGASATPSLVPAQVLATSSPNVVETLATVALALVLPLAPACSPALVSSPADVADLPETGDSSPSQDEVSEGEEASAELSAQVVSD